MSKLVTLEEWARRKIESPPSAQTLRKWARRASIVPLPTKVGRGYLVHPNAQYVDPRDPAYYEKVAQALHESEKA